MYRDRPIQIRLLAEQHGGEELGTRVGARLDAAPILGVAWKHAHPEAAQAGKRYLGSKQMQLCYGPGDSPEHKAAQRVIAWLGDDVDRRDVGVIDVHNGRFGLLGLDFLRIGRHCSKAALAAAFVLTDGCPNVLIRSDSFSKATRPVIIERSVRDETHLEQQASALYANLGRVATTTVTELEALFDEIKPSLRFLRPHELMTRDVLARPDGAWLLEALESLGDIATQTPFTDFDLPSDVRLALGLSPESRLLAGSWGHNNMSELAPQLGRFGNDQLRREGFGEFYELTTPHEEIGAWLYARPNSGASRAPTQ